MDIPIGSRLFILGPNASGKSNLIDALRFLQELTLDGGGLQQALRDRGGLPRVRNLAARNYNKGQMYLKVDVQENGSFWSYELSLTREPRGRRRPVVVAELVQRNGQVLLKRPESADRADTERLTQTALEQVNANKEFRFLSDFFHSILYLHLVPQIIRDPERSAERQDDPYGSDFLSRVAKANKRDRGRRLKVINQALAIAVPQLELLELHQDPDGRPHLEARYQHWRERGAKQNEADFSDGTLRLIGLLWSLQDKGPVAAPLLLEEPELSLHREIVRRLPSLLDRASRQSGRQVLATTHAFEVLEDPGLRLDEVVVLKTGSEGTVAESLDSREDLQRLVESGFKLSEVLAEEMRPQRVEQVLTLF